MRRLALLGILLPILSCTGTTGYRLVSFNAVAQGPADAHSGYAFTSDLGYQIALNNAVIRIGAIYLDQSVPTSGASEGTCTLPGTYVGEVRGGRDIDLLDPRAQPFPVMGDGSTIPAAVGQVWLSGPDVTATGQTALQSILPDVLEITGTAMKDGRTVPFVGAISIERGPAVVDRALPGSNPICEQRIVAKIVVDITLGESGTLVLHLDPKALFTNVDFFAVEPTGDPPSFTFSNRGTSDPDQPSRNLYANLRASGPMYQLEWRPFTP